MAYNENIPQGSDNPSTSQGQILANFQEIDTAFNLNHGNFNDADQGKHLFMQMPEQSSAAATAANEGAIYTQESALTGVTELVFRRESNGTEIEFTGSTATANGWTRLPSGILLKWGTGSGSGITAVSFPTGASIPIFSSVLNAIICVSDSSASPNTFATLRGFTTTTISIFGSSRTTTGATSAAFRYLVIGT